MKYDFFLTSCVNQFNCRDFSFSFHGITHNSAGKNLNLGMKFVNCAYYVLTQSLEI